MQSVLPTLPVIENQVTAKIFYKLFSHIPDWRFNFASASETVANHREIFSCGVRTSSSVRDIFE
jgi:hypothetical protein